MSITKWLDEGRVFAHMKALGNTYLFLFTRIPTSGWLFLTLMWEPHGQSVLSMYHSTTISLKSCPDRNCRTRENEYF